MAHVGILHLFEIAKVEDYALHVWQRSDGFLKKGLRGVAIKISGVGKAGEANVLLTRTQIKDLKALCRKAFAYREPLKEGQIEILGTFVVYDTRLEVVVLRSHGTVARCLVAHEKDKEQTFFMEESQEGALNRLLDDAAAALK